MFKPLTLAYSLEKKILLDAPIEKVWLTYRDSLPKLVSVMPTVDEIKVVSREETKDDDARLPFLEKISEIEWQERTLCRVMLSKYKDAMETMKKAGLAHRFEY